MKFFPFFSFLSTATFVTIFLIPTPQINAFNPYLYNYKNYLQTEEPSELLRKLQNHQVKEIIVSSKMDEVISIEQTPQILDQTGNQIEKTYYTKINNPLFSKKIVETGMETSVTTTFMEKPILDRIPETLGTISSWVFPLFFLSFVARTVYNYIQISNDPMGGMAGMPRVSGMFGQGQDEFIMTPQTNLSLSSWSGSPEIFNECYEIISYLKDEKLYREAGAELPKGILLEGLPGTGKTLLAKAIASEVNATFISLVGSQFVEMFVGVGAQRVREIFRTARENRPCILFIDEIDAIGKARGKGTAFNDEREQTLNQLLSEMDGFQDNEGILVIGATNLKDSLDAALLRPGRFDRIINVPLPDLKSRELILQQYIDSKPWKMVNVSVSNLASMTAGFSGADLKNLVNEATIHAVRRFRDLGYNGLGLAKMATQKKIITEKDLSDALEKIMVGIIKLNDTRSLELKQRVALHELGHAFMVAQYPHYFQLQKISIQSSYSGVGGYTMFKAHDEITEGGMYTKDFFEKRIQIALGGKACEEVFYGKQFVSLGASRDLEEANHLAKQMIEQYGMGTGYWSVYSRPTNHANPVPPLGGNHDISDAQKSILEKEALMLVTKAYHETLQLLEKNREILEKRRDLLISERTIFGNCF
jgi:cell division protease FtsH